MFFPSEAFFLKVRTEVEELEAQHPGQNNTFIVKELHKRPFPSGKPRSIRTCEDYVKWVRIAREKEAVALAVIPEPPSPPPPPPPKVEASWEEDPVIEIVWEPKAPKIDRVLAEHLEDYVDMRIRFQESLEREEALRREVQTARSMLHSLMAELSDWSDPAQSKKISVPIVRNGVKTKIWLDSRLEYNWKFGLEALGEQCIRNDGVEMDLVKFKLSTYSWCTPDFYLPRLDIFLELKDPSNEGFVKTAKERYAKAVQKSGKTILFTENNLDKFYRYRKGMFLITPSDFNGKILPVAPAVCRQCNRFYLSYYPEDDGLCSEEDCAIPTESQIPKDLALTFRQVFELSLTSEERSHSINTFSRQLKVITGGK